MRETLDKIEKYYYYMWLAILVNIGASIIYGYIKKFTNIFTFINKIDIEKYIGNNIVIETISKYTSLGLGIVIVVYIMMLVTYIFICFGVPNLMLVVSGNIIKEKVGIFRRLLFWTLNIIGLIPGIGFSTKIFTVFTSLIEVDVVLIHIAVLFLIQALIILVYIIEFIRSFNIKGDKKNGQ